MATDITEFRLPGDSRRGHSPDDAACEGIFSGLKVQLFRDRDWSGWTAERFIDKLSAYVFRRSSVVRRRAEGLRARLSSPR